MEQATRERKREWERQRRILDKEKVKTDPYFAEKVKKSYRERSKRYRRKRREQERMAAGGNVEAVHGGDQASDRNETNQEEGSDASPFNEDDPFCHFDPNTGLPLHVCHLCPLKFVRADNLKYHILQVHSRVEFEVGGSAPRAIYTSLNSVGEFIGNVASASSNSSSGSQQTLDGYCQEFKVHPHISSLEIQLNEIGYHNGMPTQESLETNSTGQALGEGRPAPIQIPVDSNPSAQPDTILPQGLNAAAQDSGSVKILNLASHPDSIGAEGLNSVQLSYGSTTPMGTEVADTLRKKKWKSYRREKKVPCSACDKLFVCQAALDVHFRSHTGDKPYVCEHCARSFVVKRSLDRHHQSVHREIWEAEQSRVTSHPCTYCELVLPDKASLREHTRTHPRNDRRGHTCHLCQKRFHCVSGLKRHLASIHSTEKPTWGKLFKCKFCDKRFKYSDSIAKHMWVHSGVKSFKCRWCEEDFETTGLLGLHVLESHPGKGTQPIGDTPVPTTQEPDPNVPLAEQYTMCFESGRKFARCNLCLRNFRDSHTARRHMVAVHTPEDQKSFHCEKCNRKYGCPVSLKHHIKFGCGRQNRPRKKVGMGGISQQDGQPQRKPIKRRRSASSESSDTEYEPSRSPPPNPNPSRRSTRVSKRESSDIKNILEAAQYFTDEESDASQDALGDIVTGMLETASEGRPSNTPAEEGLIGAISMIPNGGGTVVDGAPGQIERSPIDASGQAWGATMRLLDGEERIEDRAVRQTTIDTPEKAVMKLPSNVTIEQVKSGGVDGAISTGTGQIAVQEARGDNGCSVSDDDQMRDAAQRIPDPTESISADIEESDDYVSDGCDDGGVDAESSGEETRLGPKDGSTTERMAFGLACRLCSQTFDSNEQLQIHSAFHRTVITWYKCHGCNAMFDHLSGAEKHFSDVHVAPRHTTEGSGSAQISGERDLVKRGGPKSAPAIVATTSSGEFVRGKGGRFKQRGRTQNDKVSDLQRGNFDGKSGSNGYGGLIPPEGASGYDTASTSMKPVKGESRRIRSGGRNLDYPESGEVFPPERSTRGNSQTRRGLLEPVVAVTRLDTSQLGSSSGSSSVKSGANRNSGLSSDKLSVQEGVPRGGSGSVGKSGKRKSETLTNTGLTKLQIRGANLENGPKVDSEPSARRLRTSNRIHKPDNSEFVVCEAENLETTEDPVIESNTADLRTEKWPGKQTGKAPIPMDPIADPLPESTGAHPRMSRPVGNSVCDISVEESIPSGITMKIESMLDFFGTDGI